MPDGRTQMLHVGVQVCDVSLDTMTLELQGKAPKMAAFQTLLQVRHACRPVYGKCCAL